MMTDMLINNHNFNHDHGNMIIIPVDYYSGESLQIVNYFVNVDILLTFYQNINTIKKQLMNNETGEVHESYNGIMYLQFRFHFKY